MYTILPHMVWPYSANLRCRSEMCCTRLAEIQDAKKSPKIRHPGTIAQLCTAISSQLRRVRTVGKIIKQKYLPHMSLQYGELRPILATEIVSLVWGIPANFNGFSRLWQRYCTAL